MPCVTRIALCWIPACALMMVFIAPSVLAQTPAQTAEMSSETQYAVQPASATRVGGGALLSTMIAAQKKTELKFYASPIGKMLTNMRKPLSFMTGGLIQPNSPKDVAQHAANGAASGAANSPSGGAAAKIKADAKAAKERRANVRFLGTVDCHWYPEAEKALIASLRADRSECVRLEAARSLGRGCCCTKKTVEALKICVAGSNRDGNPSENSLRVKMAAFEALQNCLANCAGQLDSPPPPATRPEYPAPPLAPPQPDYFAPPQRPQTPRRPEYPAPTLRPQESARHGDATAKADDVLPAYYREVESRPWVNIVGEANRVVAAVEKRRQPSLNGYATGRRNLYAIWMRSMSSSPDEIAPSLAPQPAPSLEFDEQDVTRTASRRDAPQRSYSAPPAPENGAPYRPPPAPGQNGPSNRSALPPPSPSAYPPGNLQRIPPVDSGTRRVNYQRPAPLPRYEPGSYNPR
jgi:hypothetical protein